MSINIKAIVTLDRQLQLTLPDDIPIGAELNITLEVIPPQSDDDVAELMNAYHHPNPKSGAEIAAWLQSQTEPTGWEHIQDGGEWVAEQRRKRIENDKW